MRSSQSARSRARLAASWRIIDREQRLCLEPLEARALLSAGSLLDSIFAQPNVHAAAVTNPTPQGYTPAQVRAAYGVNQIAFSNGVAGDGSGQTIAIVDAYDDPNIASDLHAFDQTFGIADPPSFTKLNQNGGASLPAANAGWSEEIALDVEWAHAIAPGARILLVEANTSSLSDLLAAVDVARQASGVSVVSMSWGSSEFFGETQYDSHFTTPAGHTPVTFFASAGDSGAGASWPAASPNVVAVGGTSLNVAGGNYASETAWSGSGGGYSQVESEPSSQRSVQTSGARAIPDVGYDANPNTGVAVFDTMAINGRTGWFQIGGTSAGAPQWAALYAIADQGRALTNQSSLSGGPATIYNLPSSDFHDVTSGSNGYTAAAGYDLVTGRGSPIANAVVRDLVANATSTSTTTTTTTSSSTTTSAPTQTAPGHHRYYFELVYSGGHWRVILVTTNAVEGSTGSEPVQVSTGQVAAAIADVNSTTPNAIALTATNSAPRSTNSIESPTTPATQSTALTSGPILVAPRLVGGTGDVATALVQADVPSSDADTERGAAGDGNNRPSSQGDGAKATLRPDATEGAKSIEVPAAQPVDGANNGGEESLPRALGNALAAALDLCFSEEAWALSFEDAWSSLPDAVVGSRELDLVVVAASAAVTAHFATQDLERRPCPVSQPRRQVCRLDRR
jgi:hypothetical protein